MQEGKLNGFYFEFKGDMAGLRGENEGGKKVVIKDRVPSHLVQKEPGWFCSESPGGENVAAA